jgi:hypothetical protein
LSAVTNWKQTRGRYARLCQDLPAGHPEREALRRDLFAERLAEHIEKVVSQAPPFTPEQVDQLRVPLQPVRAGGGPDAAA